VISWPSRASLCLARGTRSQRRHDDGDQRTIRRGGRAQAAVSVQASPSRSRRHLLIAALGRSTTPTGGDLPVTAQPFRSGSTMLVTATSTLPSTVSRLVHAIRIPACSAADGWFDRCETRS
jgi:hypothetical protein